MRRHLVLMGLIGGLVLAFTWLRPTLRPTPDPIQFAPQTSVEPIEEEGADSPNVMELRGADLLQTTPAPQGTPRSEADSVASLKDRKRTYGSSWRHEVAVLNPAGQPVDDAEVIVFRTTDHWRTSVVSEVRTDTEGKCEIEMKLGVEKVLLYSYKKGVGFQGGALSSSKETMVISYLPPYPMKIWCRGPNGDLRANADLAVSAELNISTRFPDPLWLAFPARRIRADDYGKCEIEGLPVLGSSSDGKSRMPGCRFTVTATWESRTAEIKFDDFPREEVQVVIE